MSDASLGVTNPGYRPGDTATALPAGIALGASFNPAPCRWPPTPAETAALLEAIARQVGRGPAQEESEDE